MLLGDINDDIRDADELTIDIATGLDREVVPEESAACIDSHLFPHGSP